MAKVDSMPPDLEEEIESAANGWPQAVTLDSHVDPFPVHVLPAVFAEWVEAIAETTQTPPDMAALLALSVTASAVAKRYEIEGNNPDHVEPLNLYTVSVLEPGNRKSAVFRAATDPLVEYESELREALREEVAVEKSEHRQVEKRLAKCEKDAAEGKTEEVRRKAASEAKELAIKLDDWRDPKLPTLICRGPTSEALTAILGDNNERVGIFSAEGGVFDLMKGKYSKQSDFGIYLLGYSGDTESDERQSRTGTLLQSPAITIGVTVQPAVIHSLAGSPEFNGRGLLGRFLYAIPKSFVGNRNIDPTPMPKTVEYAYGQTIKSLAKMETRNLEAPVVFTLSDEAGQLYRGFMTWVESELGAGTLEELKEWGTKLAGMVLRIAGVLHCVAVDCREDGSTPETCQTVGVEEMSAATAIGKWAVGHARAAMDMFNRSDSQPLEDARYVLKWIRREAACEFTKSDIYNHGRRRFTGEVERLDTALRILSETNHVRRMGATGKTEAYEVNPGTFES